ncbi:THO complex subunit 4-A [Pseudolycoriella hygida]|uniref:THO complex subunit 4-A n=1 Tax=Pseudolycoriella hygida TaxID=35572 RepID=A0A9Q0RVY1_9DIPT|nr:THO complex subunit 4-A [Pseudolycoriella hygida]
MASGRKLSGRIFRGDSDAEWKHDLFEMHEQKFIDDERKNSGRKILGRINSNKNVDGKCKHELSEMNEKNFEDEEAENHAELFVRNLHPDVSENDLFDLFSDVGELQIVQMHYDRSQRFLGTAIISFKRKCDALESIKEFNGKSLDNKIMNIVLLESSSRANYRQGSLNDKIEM